MSSKNILFYTLSISFFPMTFNDLLAFNFEFCNKMLFQIASIPFFTSGSCLATSYCHTYWWSNSGHVWETQMWHWSWLHYFVSCHIHLLCTEWDFCVQHKESQIERKSLEIVDKSWIQCPKLTQLMIIEFVLFFICTQQ